MVALFHAACDCESGHLNDEWEEPQQISLVTIAKIAP